MLSPKTQFSHFVFSCFDFLSIFLKKTKSFCVGTNPTGSVVFVAISIFRRVFMTLWAMGSFCEVLTGVATTNVFLVKDRLKMFWVATKSIAAKVIDLFIFGDRAYQYLVNNSVCFHKSAFDMNVTVPNSIFAGCCTCPNPAICFWVKISSVFNTIWKIGKLHAPITNKLGGVGSTT
jgi:hypothetical protein